MQPTTKDAYDLFHQGSLALAEIERNGIRIDTTRLRAGIESTTKQITDMRAAIRNDEVWAEWRKVFGARANLDSHAQLAHIMFEVRDYPSAGKTEKGTRHKSDESAFENIDLPFIKNYFKLQKQVKALQVLHNLERETVDGLLHPFFHLTGTGHDDTGGAVTFRGSSSDPNFQNLPIRNPGVGKLIRECFIPPDDWYMVETDFGAIEFCGAACFWKDAGMVAYASDPSKDIHKDYAGHNFWCKRDQVSKAMRGVAKNKFIFPILYGSDYINCSRNLWEDMNRMDLKLEDGSSTRKHLESKGVSELGTIDRKIPPRAGTFELRVKKTQDRFNREFPTFAQRKEEWWAEYQAKGYFDLMTGFRVKGDYSRNFLMNCPIQGPMFHCLLWCLIRLNNWLKRHKMKTKIIGQIHDCIPKVCPPDELQVVLNKVHRIMTVELPATWQWIIVPMKVEVDVVVPGSTWFSKSPWQPDVSGVWAPKQK